MPDNYGPLRLGMLVSGGGRTVVNIQEQIAAGKLAARIELVISSRPDAAAVERCRAVGLAVEVVDRRAPDARCDERIAELLRARDVELVCLAGYLSLWRFPPDFAGRVINIHPALLPEFGGRGFYGGHVHRAVLAAGVAESGCTVHFADEHYDHGPIILQRRVPVLPGDTEETLAARVFAEEKIAYPEAIDLFIAGGLSWPGRRPRRERNT